MNFFLERVSNPEIEPVSLAEMKRHLRLFDDITTEDDDISGLITVAREWVEDYTGRVMVDSTWRLSIDDYVSGDIALRRSPALALTSFVSVAADGVETVLEDVGSPTVNTYEIAEADGRWPRLVPLTGAVWTAGKLRIEFRAGFVNRLVSPQQDASVVPAVLKQAIKLIVGHYYENRAPVVIGTISAELPLGIIWLLNSQRCNNGFA